MNSPVKLFVGNLLYEVTDDDLHHLFSQYGNVQRAEIVRYGKSKRSKGFGYVFLESPDQADAAIAALHEQDFQGRRLIVSPARSQKYEEGYQKEPDSQRKSAGQSSGQDRRGSEATGSGEGKGRNKRRRNRNRRGSHDRRTQQSGQSTFTPLDQSGVDTHSFQENQQYQENQEYQQERSYISHDTSSAFNTGEQSIEDIIGPSGNVDDTEFTIGRSDEFSFTPETRSPSHQDSSDDAYSDQTDTNTDAASATPLTGTIFRKDKE